MVQQWYGVEDDLGEEFLERFDETVRTRLSQIVLTGVNSAILPVRHCFYFACMVATPLLTEAIWDAIENYQEGENLWLTVSRTLFFLSENWLKIVIVFMFYVWLQLSYCKLGVRLLKRMSLRAAAVVVCPLLLLSVCAMWFCIQLSTRLARESLKGDHALLGPYSIFRPVLMLCWLGLALCLCGGCRG